MNYVLFRYLIFYRRGKWTKARSVLIPINEHMLYPSLKPTRLYPCSKRHVYQSLKSSIKSTVEQTIEQLSILQLRKCRIDGCISIESTVVQTVIQASNRLLHKRRFDDYVSVESTIVQISNRRLHKR